MRGRTEDLYLDLMKKTLAFALWPEPPIPIVTFNYQNSLLKRLFISFVSSILRYKHLQLVEEREVTRDQREAGEIWPIYADTMIVGGRRGVGPR